MNNKIWTHSLTVIALWAAVTSASDTVTLRRHRTTPVGGGVTVQVVRGDAGARRQRALADLRDNSPFAGHAARYAAEHQLHEATPALVAIACGERSANDAVRMRAIQALGALGGEDAVSALVAIAADTQAGYYRVLAVQAIDLLGARHRLPKISFTGDEDLLRQAIHAANHA